MINNNTSLKCIKFSKQQTYRRCACIQILRIICLLYKMIGFLNDINCGMDVLLVQTLLKSNCKSDKTPYQSLSAITQVHFTIWRKFIVKSRKLNNLNIGNDKVCKTLVLLLKIILPIGVLLEFSSSLLFQGSLKKCDCPECFVCFFFYLYVHSWRGRHIS